MEYLPALFLFLAGACNGIMDLLQFHFERSVFNGLNDDFWNPKLSWRMKWKNGDVRNGERYWGSSRWFVSLNCGWHRMKHFMIVFIILSVASMMYTTRNINTVQTIYSAFLTGVSWWIGFWTTYESKLFRYKK